MKNYLKGIDWLLFASSIVISVFGLVIIRSVSPGLFWNQLVFFILGIAVFFIMAAIDISVFAKWFYVLFLINFLGILATIFFGSLIRGSVRWLEIGPFNYQPSETIKPFFIFLFASVFSRSRIVGIKQIAAGIIFLFPVVFLIFKQPDLGTALILINSWILLLIAAGSDWRWFTAGLLSFAACLPIIWKFLAEYQKKRIYTFINPFSDPRSSGFNVLQAMTAVGSGRFFGRGLGWGTQSHLRFLPERHTDFIFASLSEELGFLGATLLLVSFVILLWRVFRIGAAAEDRRHYLFCFGVFGLLLTQVFINIGMNLGILPVTGITLPLVSYGGNSFLATMAALGMVVSVRARKPLPRAIEIR